VLCSSDDKYILIYMYYTVCLFVKSHSRARIQLGVSINRVRSGQVIIILLFFYSTQIRSDYIQIKIFLFIPDSTGLQVDPTRPV
jgi:hypothetical protein